MGAVSVGVVASTHGAHLLRRATEGLHADGRVSAVFGTHCHVPTADAQILPGGTAYQTDAGMCGDYDSVIGMQKEPAVRRFVTKMLGERPQPAEGEGTLCGILLATDDQTGLARTVEPVRIGGRLPAHLPPR